MELFSEIKGLLANTLQAGAYLFLIIQTILFP